MQLLSMQSILHFINTPGLVAFQAAGKPAFVAKMSLLGILLSRRRHLSAECTLRSVRRRCCALHKHARPITDIWRASMRLAGCSFVEWLKPIGCALVSTSAMAIAVVLLKRYVLVHVGIVEFLALIALGAVVYTTVTLFVDRSAKREIASYLNATR